MFKVKRMTPVNWKNSIVKATCDIIVMPHGIVLRDCLVKEGKYGIFVTSPSKELKEVNDEGKEIKYMDLVFFPKEIRDELNKVCMEAYDPMGSQHTADAELPL